MTQNDRDFFRRRPLLTDAQIADLLERVCSAKTGERSKAQMWLYLPNNGEWRHGGAFNSIDATPELMALFGKRTLYHVVGNDTAENHYYLELVKRVDGVHDLYLKYQKILGSRLLGGVSDEQLATLHARYDGSMPLPDFKQSPRGAYVRVVDRLAERNSQIEATLAQVAQALPSAPAELKSTSEPCPPQLAGAVTDAAPSQNAPAVNTPTLDGAALPDAAATRSRAIDADVLAVLRAGRTEDNKFYLGPERLDPKLYKRVNTVLKDLGGAWKGGKTQAHVFAGAADEAVAAVVASGEYLTAKDFGFFPTPARLAERAVAMAGLAPGMKVLEPSAGDGSLALRAAAIVGAHNVTACEFLDRNVAKLRAAGLTDVIHGDFLATEPAPIYDRCVLNPPFGNLQDVRHVEHAAKFLKPDGVLIAIMSPGYQFRNTSAATKFREFAEASQAMVEDIPAGTFRESGTEVATVLVRMEAKHFPWNNDLAELVERDDDDQDQGEEQELADAPRG
jgi:predicted RNA methylase